MKKRAAAASLLGLAVFLLAGCAPRGGSDAFTQANEIVTYRRIDLSKTQLVVSSLGNNADVKKLSDAFERRNPDVQVICLDLTGGTSTYRPVNDWVVNGVAPDVMLVNPDSFTDDRQTVEYFEDLSAHPVIERFEVEALDRVAVNGRVYFLPAPSEINCMIYNKTLFEQYGWQVPKSFDAFVALCVRIREDTHGEVEAWNPNAKYDLVFSTAIEAFCYEELFGGVANRSWYNDFCAGKATFAGHMEPMFDLIQTLIDHQILRQEHFSYSATTRGKAFQAGKIAMYNAPISRISSKAYTFDYMPYPSTTGGVGYVSDNFSAMLCVPKKERDEAKESALDRFLLYYGSEEGQQTLIGDTLMHSNVKGVPMNKSEALAGIEAVIAQGHKFSRLDFAASDELDRENDDGKASKRSWMFMECARKMAAGEKTGVEWIAQIDQRPYLTPEEWGDEEAIKLAEVTESFTVFEFSCYIADMYREKAQADIGLINHGVAYRGNLVRLFAGNVDERYLYPIKPRSFANQSTLVKAAMTGRQIMAALNHPVGNDCVSDSVYAFSGLKCEIAPWNALGEKYLSVKLADGSALDMDKLYTAAFWDGSVGDEYLTEKLEAYEGSWEDMIREKFKSDGQIAPARDGRATLVWK